MGTNDIIAGIVSMQARITELESERNNLIDAARLKNLALTAAQVAQMHGVSARTVQQYARMGKLKLHPSSTDGKYVFPALDAVNFDFKHLRRETRAMSLFA